MRRRREQLAAIVLLAICACICPRVHAQNAVDPHWLFEYSGSYQAGNTRDLKWDKRFRPFINRNLRMKQSILPHSPTMADVVFFFIGIPGEYRGDDDRYFYADGCVAHACPDKGMLWVDLKSDPLTVVFAALTGVPGSNVPGYALYIFASRELQPDGLPANLKASINFWTSKPLADNSDDYKYYGKIYKAVIVGPDGREHSLDLTAAGVPPAAQEKTATK